MSMSKKTIFVGGLLVLAGVLISLGAIGARADDQSLSQTGYGIASTTPVLTLVTVTPATSTINVGSTTALTASPFDQNSAPFVGATTTWSSLNSAVASVDSVSGIVTGVATGTANIIASTTDGVNVVIGTSTITVIAPATGGGSTTVAPVNLLSAGNFTILSETGITDTGSHSSLISGNIGSSPITAAAMNNVFCSEIAGKIYGVDAAYVGSGNQSCFAGNPPLADKTLIDNAILDLSTVYADLAGRTNPTATELGAGNIGGRTLAPGLYKWSTDVTIPTDVTLSGSANDIWIFQIAGNLDIASTKKVILAGDAKASNVFWQVGGSTGATLETYSTFNGNILSAKQIIIQTGAVLTGRAWAQTQVTLDANTVSAPDVVRALAGGGDGSNNGESHSSGSTGNHAPDSSSHPNSNEGHGNVLGASTFRFGHSSLHQGDKNDDVKALQTFLIDQDSGPVSRNLARVGATGYFGGLTRAAILEYQRHIKMGPYTGRLFPKLSRFIVSQINE